MKVKELFESDQLATVKMLTQSMRFIESNPKEVDVKYRKHGRAQKKECFNNSFRDMSDHSGEIYVLGFIFFHGIPIEHAWVKDGDTYFDVTLDPKEQQGYVSVLELSLEQVMEYVDKHQSAPSLYDYNRFRAS